MKNWLVSLAVVGALVAPGVYAEGEAMAGQAPAAMVETPAPAEAPAAEAAKEAPKKKSHHAKKKKKHGKKGHKCKNCHDKKKQVEAASNETPAEQKIDQETELNNR